MTWSMVAAFASIGEAESAKSALDAAGIYAELVDEETVAVNWLYSNAIGGVKLYVPDEELEDSEALIATAAESMADDSDDAAPPEEEETEAAALSCPACGSSDVVRVPRLRLFLFFAIAFAGVGFAIQRMELAAAGIVAVALATLFSPSHRCKACGERWLADDGHGRAPGAPPPSAGDVADELCPRCESPELHHIEYRRLKAIPLLFQLAALPVVTIWWALPKRRCDVCGYKG